MNNRETALSYLDYFCAGDLDSLASLLADDFRFTGPLLGCGSAAEYLDALKANPPEKSAYQIFSVTDNDNSVAIFYVYQKSGQSMLIAQLFTLDNEKIVSSCLVFDRSGIE